MLHPLSRDVVPGATLALVSGQTPPPGMIAAAASFEGFATVVAVKSVADVHALVGARPVATMLIVDGSAPCAAPEASIWRDIAEALVATWLWAPRTRVGITSAVAATACCAVPTLIDEWGVEPHGCAWWFAEHRRVRGGAMLAARLRPQIERLPVDIAASVLALLTSPDPPASPKQMAAASSICRRSLDRWFRYAGVQSGWQLFAASRVLRSYEDVTGHALSLGGLAAAHGFGSRSALRRQYVATIGIDPARETLPPMSRELVDGIGGRLSEGLA